ncbi:MAG: 5'-methylthioadenosine/S-adenosylhomocysteine nucleosidase [Chloroflexi bacterium]|nr:5'-methylthioadenosine/S-adenosylhomocysteine nucleosidase [Chloroflexota bacterium]
MMPVVVIISANIEWRVTLPLFANARTQTSPFGEWIETEINGRPVIFFHGGWGKIAAAASAQYIIDRWSPEALINLGTCGGFEGEIERGAILLVERAIVYDIVEQMTDPDAAIAHYTTDLDLSWFDGNPPHPVKRTLIVSGDRDLIPGEAPSLKKRFGAMAGDWESGAIAWVAARNGARCVILRGVTDLVGSSGGEAYDGTGQHFAERAAAIMKQLIEYLPAWIEKTLPANKQ